MKLNEKILEKMIGKKILGIEKLLTGLDLYTEDCSSLVSSSELSAAKIKAELESKYGPIAGFMVLGYQSEGMRSQNTHYTCFLVYGPGDIK